MTDWVGRTIDGRYVVESVLGQGGMGVVLRARHQFTRAGVALKVLRTDLGFDASIAERFLTEARAPSAIGHPGIVQVLDAGRDTDGTLYVVMELLAGETLRAAIQRGGVAARDARRISLELLDALATAHARGFVHRDLKPENVFLTRDAAKLLDFGIAKVLSGATVRTAAGIMMGTPGYMAPEQVSDASTVDARADLWAVGIMLYEMLSGRLPYQARTLETMLNAVAHEAPMPIERFLPAAPPELRAFFARALARDPAQRFASAGELAQAIAALPLGDHAPVHGSVALAPTGAAAPPPGTAPGSLGVTVASVPGVATPVASAPTPGPSTVMARSAMRGWQIVAMVGIVAIVAIVIIAIVANRKSTSTAVSDASVPHDAAGARDAPVAVSPPVDAPAMSCDQACKLIDGCGLYDAWFCKTACQGDATTQACLPKITDGCSAFADCVWTINCQGVEPHGRATCGQTALCQSHCPPGKDGFACGCDCFAKLLPDPPRVNALFHLDACAQACGLEPDCMKEHCGAAISTCASQ